MNSSEKAIPVQDLVLRARAALPVLAASNSTHRNRFLRTLAQLLLEHRRTILAANDEDLRRSPNLIDAMKDRLRLTLERVEASALALEHLASLPDPLNQRFDDRVLDNGVRLHRRRVPLGVIGVIFEARPNVTLDVAALAIKTGNGAVLRGGTDALITNRALIQLVHQSLRDNDLPETAIGFIDSPDRSQVMALLESDGVDLLIPRGGADLHAHCRRHARMPVVTGGLGICHLYVDAHADLRKALHVVRNAKLHRPTVCNALDTVLVHQGIAATFVPALVRELTGVEFRLDEAAMHALGDQADVARIRQAEAGDFDCEWLALVLGVAVVADLDGAVDHIRAHASGHSDGILTDDAVTAAMFLDRVDSAAVYWNASTRFTDGEQFGLGAEVAVSTQRVHARGPMGLEGLTSYKWVVEGDYHVRS
jgi:glutamate-5-semialdehyde dehydrogenase